MSDPKRYTFEAKEILDAKGMVCFVGVSTLTHPMGKYVSYEDYASLKAEVERLTTLVESNLNKSKLAMAKSDASVRTLEAHIERLTKAGDDLWEFAKLADTNAPKARRKALKDWNAAKEGKQP